MPNAGRGPAGAPPNGSTDKTVAAVVTPPGVGGLAVIRILGPHAHQVALPFLRNPRNDHTPSIRPHRPKLARWMDGDQHLDDVIVVSSGTESALPALNVSSHGSIRVVERILLCLEASGAEVCQELQASQIWQQVTPIEAALMEHLPRTQTQRVAAWLTKQASALDAAMRHTVKLLRRPQIEAAREHMGQLLDSWRTSNLLLAGARVVIVGPPNAGKSTLANQLFDRPWSIESDEAGTTRDWVHQPIAIDGIPMILADTAGLRTTDDELERRAIDESRPVIHEADVQILVLDGSRALDHADLTFAAGFLDATKLLVVGNKSDLPSALDTVRVCETLAGRMLKQGMTSCGNSSYSAGISIRHLEISALKQRGLGRLREAILDLLGLAPAGWPCPAIWDEAQRRALIRAFDQASESPQTTADALSVAFLPDAVAT